MKLSARDALAYFARPATDKAGVLIYGDDAMRVAQRRQQVIAALAGPDAEKDMRLDRLAGADLRRDPALVVDAVKARGFFPGARVAFVEQAPDAAAPALERALADWAPGDAYVVVTAGALKKGSALRKLFEAHPKAYAAGVYADPPSRAETAQILQDAGLGAPSGDAQEMLHGLARMLEPGDFRQTVEKIALYKYQDTAPLTVAEIEACAPASLEAGVDEVIDAMMGADLDRIAPLMIRLEGQGVAPVTLLIMAERHLRQLHRVASHPDGAAAGIGRLRPPVFGPRRDKMLRQAQAFGLHKLEAALRTLLDADLSLRSAGQTAPARGLVERAFLRIAVQGRR